MWLLRHMKPRKYSSHCDQLTPAMGAGHRASPHIFHKAEGHGGAFTLFIILGFTPHLTHQPLIFFTLSPMMDCRITNL